MVYVKLFLFATVAEPRENKELKGSSFPLCFSIHHRSRRSTVRRMGAWADDRAAVEVVEVVEQSPFGLGLARQQQLPRRKSRGLTVRKSGCKFCDAGGSYGRGKHTLLTSLLPLRRQFTRQLYEWPVLPLFKSRTKLICDEQQY